MGYAVYWMNSRKRQWFETLNEAEAFASTLEGETRILQSWVR